MTFPRSRTVWFTVLALIGVELGSWFAYMNPTVEMYVTVFLTLSCFFIAWRRPTWLLFIGVAELVIGSKGYLFYLDMGTVTVSIRMIIFLATLVATVFSVVRSWDRLRQSVISTPLLLFCGWLIVSVGIALIRGNGVSAVYTDVNAFVYLALLPAWWLLATSDSRWRERILAVLAAGAILIGVKSWIVVMLFGQNIAGLPELYRWIRNTGVGEITYINSNVYRVFFQSQIYSALMFMFGLVIACRTNVPRWWYVMLAASAMGVYISLSRSAWLGIGVACGIGIATVLYRRQWPILRRSWIVLPLGLIAWMMMTWALSFPYFSFSGGRSAVVASRFNGADSASASTSRTNQIRPLLQVIARHPVIGSGFGTMVTYRSADPRTPGMRTTTAFELGYLDLLVKIGLVGTLLYGWWIYVIQRTGKQSPWYPGFMFATLALIIIHATSPYLNHPLGLGWLMIFSLYAYDRA